LNLGALNIPGFVDGIDVSMLQHPAEYERVREAGFRFCIVKGSEGPRYIDPKAEEHIAGCQAAGLLVGVYGYARPGDPVAQADNLLKAVGSVWLPRPVLDLEDPSFFAWEPSRVVDFAEKFLDRLDTYGAADAVFYTYPSFAAKIQPALSQSSRLARARLWLAQYFSLERPVAPTAKNVEWAKPPKPWTQWDMWQYSGNKGYRVPGVGVDCDRNLFRGTPEELRTWFGRG
jgi:GH25 family lysozyme M1 (1,4-beta-N-acetylmuramidase)